jgi:hypothetical protein
MPIVICVVNAHALSVCASVMLSIVPVRLGRRTPRNMGQNCSLLMRISMVQLWSGDGKSVLAVLLRDLQRLVLRLFGALIVCRATRRLDGR